MPQAWDLQGRSTLKITGKQAPKAGGLHALFSHILGFIGKASFHLIFNGQRFDGFGTGDTFVEIAGDPGVDLPHLPVDADHRFWKIA